MTVHDMVMLGRKPYMKWGVTEKDHEMVHEAMDKLKVSDTVSYTHLKEARECGAGRYFMLKAYLIQALCMIIREQREEKQEFEGKGYIFQSTGKKYVVQQIMKYMEENYREKISLEQIAANMYLSSFYIAKIFKSETGDTPINYLIGLKMCIRDRYEISWIVERERAQTSS